MSMKFTKWTSDPETVEFFIDNVSIGRFDHDGIGWDGLDAVSNLFESIARRIDANYEEFENYESREED